MSRGLNKVMLIGNVGNDPEIKYTQGGMAVAIVRFATSNERKDRDGNRTEHTEWHRIKFFGKLAEIVEQYVKKGDKLYVDGTIHYDQYEKDGETRYITEIIGNEMQMLGGGEGGGRSRGRDDDHRAGRGSSPRRETASRPAPRRETPARREPDPAPHDDFDDDIPF